MEVRAIGQQIGGRYQISRRLSSGGMGTVYAAVDTQLFDQPVAIKVLSPSFGESLGEAAIDLRRRFQEEARICAQLGSHPHIVQIKDYGLDQDQPYLVMELLGGPSLVARTLRQLLAEEKTLAPTRVLALAQPICGALHYAHTCAFQMEDHQITGVIHRDLKPANIMVLQDLSGTEGVKVLDFGVAKLMSDVTVSLGTGTFGFIGTMHYASPEQLRGEELDIRSDIYSLGIILYELLTGHQPLHPTTQSFPGWYEAHNYKSPRRFEELESAPALPHPLEALILACLEKDPRNRPISMLELSQALTTTIHDTEASTVPHAIPGLSPKVPASVPAAISAEATAALPPKIPAAIPAEATAALPRISPGSIHPSPSKPTLGITGPDPQEKLHSDPPTDPPTSHRSPAWLTPRRLWIGAGAGICLGFGLGGIWIGRELPRPQNGMWIGDWLLPVEESFLSSQELQNELEMLTVEVLENPIDPYLHLDRGIIHIYLDQPQQALADFTEATYIAPRQPEAYMGLGLVHLGRGNFRAALKQLDQALELDPNFPDALYYRGLARVRTGNRSTGIRDLERAADLFDEDHDDLALEHTEDLLNDILERRLH